MGRPEGRRPLRRSRGRWEDNIKMDLQEVVWEGMVLGSHRFIGALICSVTPYVCILVGYNIPCCESSIIV